MEENRIGRPGGYSSISCHLSGFRSTADGRQMAVID
jgi:hypothetical protein